MGNGLRVSPLAEPESLRRIRRTDWIAIALLALGAALRLFQYAARSSFWGDELAIVLNVSQRGILSLVAHPLASDQMAPAGFLFLLKLIANVAGISEYTFRFIPLLSSLVALPLFALLCRKYLSRPAMLLALAAFAVSPPLIRYAAQVKPYASDVALSLLCLLAAQSWIASGSRRSGTWLAVAGAVGIWFSYPLMFVVASIGLVVLVHSVRQKSAELWKQTVAIFAVWVVSTGALALLEHHRFSPGTHSYMLSFWANWLMPKPLDLRSFSGYVVRLLRDCLTYFLRLPLWPVIFALLLAGIVSLVRRMHAAAALMILPLLSVLAASMLRIYPFSGRLILFLVPELFLLIAAGVEFIAAFASGFTSLERWRAPVYSGMLAVAVIPLCLWPIDRLPPPYYNSETRPLIAYLGAHRQAGDAIYVHNMAWGAYVFYGPRYGLRTDEAIVTSPVNILGPKPFVVLTDMDRLRGRSRVWLLFGGGYPVESSCVLKYLDSIGTRLDHQSAVNANIFLYDLSGRARLQQAAAESFIPRLRTDSACTSDAANPVGPQQ